MATYGQNRSAGHPLWLGSVKSNIGHTQAAAGVAGVIKMVLAMHHATLPRTLHADHATDRVDWTGGAVSLLTRSTPWPTNGQPRRAGISAFGISGTNAHIIVEQAPADQPGSGVPRAPADGTDTPELAPVPCLVSARTSEALRAQAARLRDHVDGTARGSLVDIGYSLATTRAPLAHRAAVLAGDHDELLAGLDTLARGGAEPNVVRGEAREGQTAFLFTGQGSQRARMGQELAATFPVFARTLDEVCALLEERLERPLREVLFAEDGSAEAELLHQTVFAQTSLFAVEVALARLLGSWGLRPDYLLGHSVGELTAAHLAGVLSLEDASTLVAARGRLMQALPSGGSMVAVQAAEEEMLPLLAGRDHEVSLAATNGPQAVVISGDADAVLDLAAHWRQQGRKVRGLRVSHAFHSAHMEPMLAEFRAVAARLSYSMPRIPVVSNVTGGIVSAEELGSPDYWVRQVRGTVRFAQGVDVLLARGVRTFLELGPDGVLTAMGQDCAAASVELTGEYSAAPTFTATLRPDRAEAPAVTAAVARAHVSGATIDWAALFGDQGARPVDLPTYAFQPARYWLAPSNDRGNATAVGAGQVEHPLLGAAVELPDTDGYVFTGRLSARDHAWLCQHGVLGTPLLPGTAYLDMVAVVAERLGCAGIAELTLHAPLALPAQGGITLCLTVSSADDSGQRTVALHSRPEVAGPETPWVRHASGALRDAFPAPVDDSGAWPPPDAVAVDVADLYHRLAERGFDYGPLFRGLVAAWRQGDDVLAEVRLPDSAETGAGQFFVHPALLDSALHAIALIDPAQGVAEGLPFAFRDVRLGSRGAEALRVHVTATGGGVSLTATDATGRRVLSVGSLVLRPMPAMDGVTVAAPLYTMEWHRLPSPFATRRAGNWAVLGHLPEPLSAALARAGHTVTAYPDAAALHQAVTSGAPTPDTVLATCSSDASGADAAVARQARETTHQAVRTLTALLADELLAAARLVVLTRGAVAVPAYAEVADLAAAPLWGLVRTVQSEHPGRCVLVDLDDHDASRAALADAVDTGEPQTAVRAGEVYLPRLALLGSAPDGATTTLNRPGTVLITGGTTGLGALLAGHLVRHHGVGRLLLVSRRGDEAPGASAQREELRALGAHVDIAACDVSDRESVRRLLATIRSDHPLIAVVHAAGVVDDGITASLTAQRIDRAMLPKVDGAVHLHELTRDADLAAFVLFSSLAGVLGGAGQGNYAAANAFLDALAGHRRAAGLPATSIAWGPWAHTDGMASRLRDGDLRRLRESGLLSMSPAQGLAAFDAALAAGPAVVAPVRLDMAAFDARPVPPLLSGLAPRRQPDARRDAADTPDSLRQRLTGLVEPDQQRLLLELLRTHTAAVLGHAGAENIDPTQGFLESGFDSLTAVELRNHLNLATGLRLPTTLLFDYPTPLRLAEHLRLQLLSGHGGDGQAARPTAVLDELVRLESTLATAPVDRRTRAAVVARLQDALAKWSVVDGDDAAGEAADAGEVATKLRTATAEEMFEFIDNQI
ncbi:MAG TPA: type I polyketide synthase [Amycolatopsis sp.]|uniref:type I polyketide synthase n=1 Tax=Amycolatopsis sp. TaxID=37632 RepID=UPI002B492184|nr:type I polyketide synthase [Amycolatopsis sp.]HKS47458.1 type I polyketide synthase [Amycolatopsis sp.]